MPTIKQKIAKAIKEGKVTNKETMATFVMVEELQERLDQELPQIKNILEKVKGDQGDKGDKGEKGSRGEAGQDGKDGKDGQDGTNGKDGNDGQDGKDGITPNTLQIIETASRRAVEAVAPLVPNIEDILNQIPILSTEVRDALELLKGDERLDASAIKGLDEFNKKTQFGGGSIARNFYQLFDVPQSYAGQSGKVLSVKSTENGLEFTAASGGYTNLTEFVAQTAWRVFYSNGSGDVTELALGADGTFLKSNGASSAPTFATPAGSGDVSKVGTPANNQVGVWTGDGTIEGDAALTFDTATDTLTTALIVATTVTANLTGNVTGNASGTAATVTGAAQTSITSLGTLTVLQVDNININGNTISSTAGTDLLITPLAGQQLILDGTIEIDAGVVTGATSITSTVFVGALTGNADTATLAAEATILDTARTIGGVSFDGSANITVATATGGFTVSGGALALGANDLTMTGSLGATGARLTKGWFTDLQVTNAIVGSVTGNAATVTTNANLTGHVTSTGNAAVLGSFTIAQLNTAVSDADVATIASPTFTGTVVLPTTSLTGIMTLAENAAIALDPAGSADGKYSGITVTGLAGYTQAFGDLVYLDPTDSRWEAADANAAAAADGDSRGVLGIVVVAGTDGNACTILLQGIVRADTAFPALTINAPVYVSETAGDIVVTQPTTTDVVIRVVGFALTADEIFFSPNSHYFTHT